MDISSIIKQGQYSVVDVRSPQEFMGGHVQGSINIPLQELPDRINELKHLNSPVILCCASGNRSGQAHRFLSQRGISCVNGGSWLDVNYAHSKSLQQ